MLLRTFIYREWGNDHAVPNLILIYDLIFHSFTLFFSWISDSYCVITLLEMVRLKDKAEVVDTRKRQIFKIESQYVKHLKLTETVLFGPILLSIQGKFTALNLRHEFSCNSKRITYREKFPVGYNSLPFYVSLKF